VRHEDEDWGFGRSFTDKRGQPRPQYLLCAECGCEVDDAKAPGCCECGCTKPERQIRPNSVSKVLHEDVYEGLHEEVPGEATSGASGAPVYVYAFINPIDHSVIYIGITRNPAARRSAHFCGDSPVRGWREKMAIDPVMLLLEECATLEVALYKEAFLIAMIPNLINRDVESKKNATLRKLVTAIALAPTANEVASEAAEYRDE
jgi:hypothetical protein